MSLQDKYQKALKELENERQVAILIKQEEQNGIIYKWRLVVRRGNKSPFHTLEILEPESGVTIQIPLLGNWERTLGIVDKMLTNLSMDTFEEVVKELLALRQQPPRGRREKEI
ncbi:MAG: hypothetical protein QXY20_08935 [Thermofilum sp.]|uniref:hypothetical protein n=1 Tax=Thermofilum sp. TaxID=1961369 RepID=UPI0031666C44